MLLHFLLDICFAKTFYVLTRCTFQVVPLNKLIVRKSYKPISQNTFKLLRGVQLLNLEDGPFFGLEIRAVGRRRCPSVGQYMLLKHSSPIFIYYIDTPDCHV